MKVQQLLSHWESSLTSPANKQTLDLRLSVEDTAKIHALAEMYPNQTVESILSDIFAITLQEVNGKLSKHDPIKH